MFQVPECWRCESDGVNDEIKLKNHLLCDGMDIEERPENANGTVVRVKLFIKYFDYIDATAEITIHSWLAMSWFDSRLKWDPKDFGGISRVVLEDHEIWMPRLALFNSPTTQFDENCASTPCHVVSSGQVSCIPSCTHSAFCKTNFKNWPFDIQNCTFHMGSWINSGDEIRFVEQQIIIDKSGLTHNEYKIIKIKVRNNIGKFKNVNYTYPSIHYNIVLERHGVSEMAFVFLPAIILAFLNVAVLWLSPCCLERMFLIILLILLHFFTLEQLVWLLPRNGDEVPIVLLYFRDSLIITQILLAETMLCRGLLSCRRNSPQWIRSFTETLRGHKVGQFMFENPYLINRGTNMRPNNETTTNDSVNLVDSEAGNKTENQGNSIDGDNIWFFAVKLLDTILFLILVICYIVMLIGWFPDVRSDYLDEKTVDISNNTSI
ncbi:neuronal acetylcholine receptor subunit beta-3-like [Condylostylus longicornis]|uniref:neuronal acetylcholine receptor subunit beta-3-like n=1 Tax=Condylostylus longicornis TaxID=2530218 RepID=UPI00244DC8D8|nr:neuronal acetylcholine receptor subunit beta-3-like [Condylostylus longicornis]